MKIVAPFAVAALSLAAPTAADPAAPVSPRARTVLEIGQLGRVVARCPFSGPIAFAVLVPRRGASDGAYVRIGAARGTRVQIDPGRRAAFTAPTAGAHHATAVIRMSFSQPREPHTIVARVRMRIALDPSNGHRPDCTLLDASVRARTRFHF